MTEGIGPLAVVVGLMLATVLLVGVGERIRRLDVKSIRIR